MPMAAVPAKILKTFLDGESKPLFFFFSENFLNCSVFSYTRNISNSKITVFFGYSL